MENLNLPPFVKGDKAVYVAKYLNGRFIAPKKNEVVIILDSNFYYCNEWHFKIVGFETNVFGDEQWFHHEDLKPIQRSKFHAVSFEKIMEETEKICVN